MPLPPSPKRVFSAAKSSRLNALGDSEDSAGIPFGSEWPPKKTISKHDQALRQSTSSTINAGAKPAQWSPTRSNATSELAGDNGTTKAQQALKGSITKPSLLTGCSAAPPQPKSFSKGSKENATVSLQPVKQLNFDPPLVQPLPTYSYKDFKPPPTRVYVRHEEEADDLLGGLSGAVGFDIEWKVIFTRGQKMRPAATVQISDRRMILIVQVSAMKGFPKRLKELLEDPKIPKVGANILNDGKKLTRDYGVRAQGLIELGALSRQADDHYVERYFHASELINNSSSSSSSYSSSTASTSRLVAAPAMAKVPSAKARKPGTVINLATIVAMYTARALPKGPVRMSDWEMQPLSELQLEYAANDAHSALMVYDRLIAIAKAASVVLEPEKYASGVDADYDLPSSSSVAKPVARTSAPLSFKPMPLFQAPGMIAKTSSSSSSSSTLASCFNSASASTSAYSVSSSSSSSATNFTSGSVRVQTQTPSSPSKKAISSVTYADVSDDDVEVLEVRVVRSAHRHQSTSTTTTCISMAKSKEKSPFPNETMMASSSTSSEPVPIPIPTPSTAPRGRPGPRFKPSYDTLPATNASRASSPTKLSQSQSMQPENVFSQASGTGSKNPSPERSPRFKPSYNTTLSRSPSPVKVGLAPAPDPTPSSQSVPSQLLVPPPSNQQPQHIRAYNLWHIRQFSLPDICAALRSREDPLKGSTVISYVVTALQTDPKLHFSRDRLRALLSSEPNSWAYYRDWFRTLNINRYVNMDVSKHGGENSNK